MMSHALKAETTYLDSGVDTDSVTAGLNRATERFMTTWDPNVKLEFNYFANVIDLGGFGVAVCTDGIGSKALIAQMVGKYDTIGIDCVAMNVNDLICVGARPVSFVDYLAIERAAPKIIDEISIGLTNGAKQANISISGGETAQLPDIIKGYSPGLGFDLSGTAIGSVDLEKILIGQGIKNNDAVIGVSSNGIHSNGLTLARRVFFDVNDFSTHTVFSELGHSLGDELLAPTYIYVNEILDVLDQDLSIKALIHITSDGFMNLTRVASQVGYVIDTLPPPPAIFSLIEEYGNVDKTEMFAVYNMGIGFCLIVDQDDASDVIRILESHGRTAVRIGTATTNEPGTVTIPAYKLKGKGKRFYKY